MRSIASAKKSMKTMELEPNFDNDPDVKKKYDKLKRLLVVLEHHLKVIKVSFFRYYYLN